MVAATLPNAVARFLDLAQEPQALLGELGNDARLNPCGGGNFGRLLDLRGPEYVLTVPTERFFRRSNGPALVIDPQAWPLIVAGEVGQPLTWAGPIVRRCRSGR